MSGHGAGAGDAAAASRDLVDERGRDLAGVGGGRWRSGGFGIGDGETAGREPTVTAHYVEPVHYRPGSGPGFGFGCERGSGASGWPSLSSGGNQVSGRGGG